MATVLTIAGSDSSGRAGLQADLRAFAAARVAGQSAVTAITVQDEGGVRAVHPVAPELVAAQIDAAFRDRRPDAVKIGMLANAAIVRAVAGALARHGATHVVLDPVLASSEGAALLDADAWPVLIQRIFPIAEVITPNAGEAAALTGLAVWTQEDAERAAMALRRLGARSIVVKGGHIAGPAIDILLEGDTTTRFDGARLETGRTHGTGCAFASTLAAHLALGADLVGAVRAAKTYVTQEIM